jgi:hypothetical protein
MVGNDVMCGKALNRTWIKVALPLGKTESNSRSKSQANTGGRLPVQVRPEITQAAGNEGDTSALLMCGYCC